MIFNSFQSHLPLFFYFPPEEDDGRIILKNLPNTQEPDEIGPQASQALENILMALYVHSEDDYLDITANEMNPSLAGNITKSNGKS